MVSDTFNITALIIWIVRTIIYIFFIGIKQTVYIKPMITRVPVSISVGTRGTRELLMSLLVEALSLARSLNQSTPATMIDIK